MVVACLPAASEVCCAPEEGSGDDDPVSPKCLLPMYTQRDSNVLGGVTAARGIRFQTRTTYATC